MRLGIFESLVYGEKIYHVYKKQREYENISKDIITREIKEFIDEFEKEFSVPVVCIDIGENPEKEYLKIKKAKLPEFWKKFWDICFTKITRLTGSTDFDTSFSRFIEIESPLESINTEKLGPVLKRRKLSINLLITFRTFMVYELFKQNFFEKNIPEQHIFLKGHSWNPRIGSLLQKKESPKQTKEDFKKYLKDRFSEIERDIEKVDKKELFVFLHRELSKIIRYTGAQNIESGKEKKKNNLFSENHIYYLLKLFREFEKLGIPYNEFEKELQIILAEGFKFLGKEKAHEFKRYFEKKLLGIEINARDYIWDMNSFFKEFIIPLYEYKLLEKKIVIYPVENLNNLNPKELIAFSFIPEKAFIKLKGAKRVSIKTKISSEEKEQIKKFLDKTKRVISVLIYDIRSSTFMSLSLLDAEKELSVKREFQKIMKETVISNGGFPVKETGDGGIAFFAENSGELYRYIYEESVLMGTNIRFQKALQPSLKIESSPLSAYKALKCAIEMTKKSEEFIRKNYTNYRGWFPDVLGKDNPVKSLFRLGIGITSASNEKEIFLSFNAFGDYDVQGPALNIATILSEVRDPFSSSILIDHKTFSSLLQNTRDIGIYCPPENIEDFLELFDKPKVFELKKELYRLKNTGFVDLEEFLKEKMYKKEKIYSIKIDEDFLYINEKRGVMVYECKR